MVFNWDIQIDTQCRYPMGYPHDISTWDTSLIDPIEIPRSDIQLRYPCGIPLGYPNEISNSDTQCRYPSGISAWDIHMRYPLEISNWDSQMEISRWDIQMRYRNEISKWDIQMRFPNQISRRDIHMRYPNEIYNWDIQSSYPNEISRWDILRHMWDIHMRYRNQIFKWDIQMRYRNERANRDIQKRYPSQISRWDIQMRYPVPIPNLGSSWGHLLAILRSTWGYLEAFQAKSSPKTNFNNFVIFLLFFIGFYKGSWSQGKIWSDLIVNRDTWEKICWKSAIFHCFWWATATWGANGRDESAFFFWNVHTSHAKRGDGGGGADHFFLNRAPLL